jgi:hypothetical protein
MDHGFSRAGAYDEMSPGAEEVREAERKALAGMAPAEERRYLKKALRGARAAGEAKAGAAH